MRLGTALVILGLMSACPSSPEALTTSGSLDNVRVSGFLSPSRSEIQRPVVVDILLQNTHQTATISALTLDLPQFKLQADEKAHLRGLALPPKSRLLRTVTIVPIQTGPFDVLVQVLTPTDASLVAIARLEVIAPPGFWVTYLPLTIPVAVALAAAAVTVLIQLHVLRVTKQQKASESVVQIVTSQGRDYYFAVSGALKEFASTLERLSRAAAPLDGEHLSRRAFFFFGVFLYKENEFAFRYGYLYLGHLWAEGAIRRILDEVSSLFPLAPPDEAVVHKCFSDMDRLHRGAPMPEQDPCLFKIRTLYDLEAVLIQSDEASGPVRDLQRAFTSVRAHFTDQATLRRLQVLTRAFRIILEYEFTRLFQDWYAGPKGERHLPKEPPPEFDEITTEGSWAEVLKTLNEHQTGEVQTGNSDRTKAP